MTIRLFALCYILGAVSLFLSCSEAPSERASRHERRGDEYVHGEKFREAVIEYRNAARAMPDSPTIQWKLAKTASQIGDLAIASAALSRVVQLDPSHFDAQWSLGDLYLAAGKSEEAAKIADKLLTARPQHPAGYLLRAGVALGADRIDDAIKLLQQAVDHDPTMVRPLLALANIYFGQRDRDNASEWYHRALKADPDSVEVRVALGQFFFATGALEEGRREFRKAVDLSPDQEHIRLVLTDRYLALGLRSEAERELSGLVADMNSYKARKTFAELRLAVGQVTETKPLVNAILEADEHDPVGLYLKGRIALAEKDVVQAVSLFEESIGRNVALAGPHLYLGLIRSTQGRMDQAEEELREAIRREPGNQTAHLALASLYLTQRKPAEAKHEARQTLRMNPANLEAAILFGDALVLEQNWTRAEDVYGAIVRQLPELPVGYAKMAALRKVQGHPADAATLFSQALLRAPNDLVILQEYLVALVESKQDAQANRVLGEYLTKASRDPNLWRLAGRFYISQQKTDQAEKAFRKAVDLAPDLALVHYELGQLYFSERKFSAAESAFRIALKKEETNSAVHTALGLVLALRGQMTEANDHYRRAVQLDATNAVAANNLAANLSERQDLDDALGLALSALNRAPANPAIKDTLGWIYYKKERFADAHRLLAEASAALPRHPAVRYHHAMTLSKIGKQEEALAELKTALSLPGGFPEADRAAQMVASNRIED